jgi:hypothetical protein
MATRLYELAEDSILLQVIQDLEHLTRSTWEPTKDLDTVSVKISFSKNFHSGKRSKPTTITFDVNISGPSGITSLIKSSNTSKTNHEIQ